MLLKTALCLHITKEYVLKCTFMLSWICWFLVEQDAEGCTVTCPDGQYCNADNTCVCQTGFQRVGDGCEGEQVACKRKNPLSDIQHANYVTTIPWHTYLSTGQSSATKKI